MVRNGMADVNNKKCIRKRVKRRAQLTSMRRIKYFFTTFKMCISEQKILQEYNRF